MLPILVALLFSMLAPRASVAQGIPVWVGFQQHNGIAYLLRKSPAQIMRFDLPSKTWLAPVSLAAIPDAFLVTDTHFYVAFDSSVERLDLDGGSATPIFDAPEDVIALHIDQSLLFVNHSTNSARLTSIDLTTGSMVDSIISFREIYGSSISTTENRIIGRTTGIPGDIAYVDYDDDGFFLGGDDSNYHADYPDANRTWTFPDGDLVSDDQGIVYDVATLEYRNAFPRPLVDLVFDQNAIVGLSGDVIHSFEPSLVEAGRYSLASVAKNIASYGGSIFAFIEDSSAPAEVDVIEVAFSQLTPVDLPVPQPPEGLAYTVDATAVDAAGIVYLLSSDNNAVYRWKPQTQRYLQSIAVPVMTTGLIYSAFHDALFVLAQPRTIHKVPLSGAGARVPRPHLNTPLTVSKILTLDDELLASINGSFYDHWVYGGNGELLKANLVGRYYHLYDPASGLIYLDWYSVEYLGGGVLGPTHAVAAYGYNFFPQSVSPNGLLVLVLPSDLYGASDLTLVDSIANPFDAHVWRGSSTLFTLEPPLLGQGHATVQRWNEYFQLDADFNIPGSGIDLVATDHGLVAITDVAGIPQFTLLNDDLELLTPPQIEAPILSVGSQSAITHELSWTDVFGEEVYVVERAISPASTWSAIATLSVGKTDLVDGGLTPGVTYEYRVRAENGAVVSPYSNVVSVYFDPPTPVDPEAVVWHPNAMAMSSTGDLYLLSGFDKSIFTWSFDRRDWGRTIALLGWPSFMTYAEEWDAIFTGYGGGGVHAIDLESDLPFEALFADLTPNVCGIVAVGSLLVTCDRPGFGSYSYRTFDSAGFLSSWAQRSYTLHDAAWNPINGLIYRFRNGTGQNYMVVTPLSGSGEFGIDYDSPLHSYQGWEPPIRVKPDGSIVLLGSGRIHDGIDLSEVGQLPGDIVDALWRDGDLITLTPGAINTNPEPSYAFVQQATLAHTGLGLFTFRDSLIVVEEDDAGSIVIEVFDRDFQLEQPPVFKDGFE